MADAERLTSAELKDKGNEAFRTGDLMQARLVMLEGKEGNPL